MIRARRDDDLAALAEVLERVAADGYPPHRPPGIDIVRSADELASFVYEDDDGQVAGHVALHQYSARSVMTAAASATARPVEELCVVARLFVDPAARRAGIAGSLLAAATQASRRLGRTAVLDVWEHLGAAIALYESANWERVATVDIRFRSPCSDTCVHEGDGIRSFVYVEPA